ncbi:YczE/YyaS/YitT family protein [Naasia aerilata]|uniref:Membrane protein n=1 Tax=Naasia aerilata TaxID=1162966 RepID=A0ABN6XMN3_9MICO|nr:hypothetical protein [Naasia aerilata]BDZ46164.1 membrane protein [Naasia aerilata]
MTDRLLLARWSRLLAGLVLYGLADGLIVQAGVGVTPWDVLAQGLSLRTGMLFGVVTIAIGALLLLLWIPLRQRPGVGTLLNVLIVGAAAQVVLWILPTPEPLLARIGLFVLGLLLLAVATGLYVGAHFGAGPRDGLMMGISRRFRWPIWVARTTIEGTVVAVGWLLGGNASIGTLAFALLIGPLCQFTIPFFALPVAVVSPVPTAESRREDPTWHSA